MADRNDILLKEYEVCQQDINLHISRYWVAAGIFIGINTALWGVAAYNLIPITTSLIDTEWLIWPILVFIFGSGMIMTILFLERWGNRLNWLIRIKYDRMQQIESEVGMKANLTVNDLDNWNNIPEVKKQYYDNMHKRFPPPPREFPNVKYIFRILISLWVILILISWLFPILSQL